MTREAGNHILNGDTMTVPTSTKAAASPARPGSRTRKPWVTPALARIDGSDAENSAKPVTTDGGFSMGS